MTRRLQWSAALTAGLVAGVLGAGCAAGSGPAKAECGNGLLEEGEACDLGPLNSDLTPDGCRRNCVLARCGDGVMDTGETCDDGNNLPNDGCSASCQHEVRCGDGLAEAPEQCDDGNLEDGDGCNHACLLEFVCGDGLCDTTRNETCLLCPQDCCPCGDGLCETAKGETCALCLADCCPDCGDGRLDPNEQCDDGNNVDQDGCSAVCVDEDGVATCGNGIWETGETCEDGNVTDGDGCSSACQREFVCGDGVCASASGETCLLCQADCCPDCGNGVLDPGEECDQADLGGVTCTGLCYDGGTPTCTADCSLDVTTCTGTLPACGDGVAECGEECDGGDLGGQTCAGLGYADGTLGCTTGCVLDPTGCGPSLYDYQEGFEGGCPAGWTLGGDWQCGVPTSGPGSAHAGTNVLGTVLTGSYANNLAYASCTADSPSIVLPAGSDPYLQLYLWLSTESCCDGLNLKISTDGGASYALLSGVSPAYDASIGGEQAWRGDKSASGWQLVTADLAAYAGQTVKLRLAFRSDSSVVNTGAYVDDVAIVRGVVVPLVITTPSPLPGAWVGEAYATTVQRTGGDSAATWSIVGGTNHGWLSMDPATGALTGTPGAGDLGGGSVTVRVEEPSYPTNFAEATFTFSVGQRVWLETFDLGCPAGWTLGGDWQCGAPTTGPNAARSGPNCLATLLAASYNNNQAWTTAVATSPPIDLTATTAPELRFWSWVYTEGSIFDGFNLKISTDGGASFSLVTTVTPAYNLTVNGESAWGGNQSSSGWREVVADLSAYAGQSVILRFAFRSDGSITYAGVYLDDLLISD